MFRRLELRAYLPVQIGRAICQLLLNACNMPEELELSQKELFQSLLDEILGAACLKGESSAYIQILKLSHSQIPTKMNPGLDPGVEKPRKAA
ncbi:MAG: hypothetical protein LBU32_24855 [Clostridiales bacterium]|nr:hypothetical protein [Clostridiales bacterium]